jgi:hypothetical protein
MFYEKTFDLSSSFVFKHFRGISKNFSINSFSNLKLSLLQKFSSLVISANLVDRILIAQERFLSNEENFISSALTSASLTSFSSDVFTRNSEITTSADSSNLFEFSELSNQNRSNIVSSIDFTIESMFFAAQRSKIADIVIAAVRTIQMQQLTSSFTSETQSIAQTADFIEKWTIDEIDFFDSNVESDDSVVNAKRHVFYKNVYVFVNRLKNMINIWENDKLRIVLSQCFRDATLIWHSIELFDMKKDLLRQINLSFWYQALINRFKKRTFLTLSALQNFKYTLSDARSEKDSRLFAQQIFRSIKTINMNWIHNQLTIV